jgi:hypothetical protein
MPNKTGFKVKKVTVLIIKPCHPPNTLLKRTLKEKMLVATYVYPFAKQTKLADSLLNI